MNANDQGSLPDSLVLVTATGGEEKGDNLELLEKCKTVPPRKWDVDMTAAWLVSLGLLLPDENRRLFRVCFNGKNLVGSGTTHGTQPLAEDDVHNAMGVLQHWTMAEVTAAYDKAGITGNVPTFEDGIDRGDALYKKFAKDNSLEKKIIEYFQGKGHRPLAERLWADLALIDDASRARDARRIFKILAPHLKDLRRHQQGFDLVDEATARTKQGGREGERERRKQTVRHGESGHCRCCRR